MRKIPMLSLSVLLGLLGLGLVLDSAAVADGVRRGLEICGGVLIPSLFPFMALSCFLTGTEMARILSLPLTPITTRVFRLPAELGSTVLLSAIGGYPVGAKMVSGLLDSGRISEADAGRMLCFCYGASPSFVISAVGMGMLMNRRAGAALFLAQLLATVLVGAAGSLGRPIPQRSAVQRGGRGDFVAAVTDAAAAMLNMCAFAVLFSGLLSLLKESGLPALAASALGIDPGIAEAFFAGLFEVTGGSLAAAGLGGEAAIVALSFCCSWGGISVIFQAISCFRGKKPGFGPFLLSRIVHGFLSAGIALPLYRRFCAALPAWSSAAPPLLEIDPPEAVASLCLLAMCSILVMGVGKRKR